MNNDPERQKLLDKVRKLLALAQSSNEHEASLAAMRAQEIVATYNLSMEEVHATTTKSRSFVIDCEMVIESYPWKRRIANGVAQMYFCTFFYYPKHLVVNKRRVRFDVCNFVGEQHNVDVAKLMFEYLVTTIQRLAREHARAYHSRERDKARRSFEWGACVRMCQRLHERLMQMREQRTQTYTGTTLPALASLYDRTRAELTEFIEENVGKLRTKNTTTRVSSGASYRAGIETADTIGLDTQVGASAVKRIA